MNDFIYDKTVKGHEEIATRNYHLPPRLRSLLVLVDGKNSGTMLCKKVAGLGLDEQHLQALIDDGFIAAGAAVTPTTLAPTNLSTTEAPPEFTSGQSAGAPPKLARAPANSEDEAAQFKAIYTFMIDAVKSTLGLRGLTLQLKIERANSIHDFVELRKLFIQAVLKSKGKDVAINLRDHLDALLPDTIIQDDPIIPD